MNRKIAAIFILSCLAIPIATTYLFLQLQKKKVKKEVKWKMIAGIDKEELVLLKFTEAESQSNLRWEHSREFEYKGQMYDIVEKQIIGDTIYYWCWWDHEETKLNKKLDGLVAKMLGGEPKRREKQNKVADFFMKLFYERHTPYIPLTSEVEIEYFSYTEHFKQIYPSPPVPPPRLS